MLTVGSLFSNVGLLDLGLEQAGMKTIWQVEIDDWCRQKLEENFPHTEKFKDVREVGKHNLKPTDVICGGFPCQDISVAKHNAEGLAGERSGLWSEFFRIIREFRPRYALIENVSNLVNFGLDRLLSDLASIRYDAEWQTLRAETFGLPHRRKRLFIIAYPERIGFSGRESVFRTLNPGNSKRPSNPPTHYLESIGMRYPSIPETLRVGDGRTFELSEIERAVKAYGNGVAVLVARWLGEQIIRFDREVN